MDHKQAAQPAPTQTQQRRPTLPVQISSPTDVSRLVSELDQIDEMLMQLSLRSPGSEVKMPKTSRMMDLLVEHNSMNLLKPEDRSVLKQFLALVKDKAPRLHISFGADPAPAFMEKLMTWLRQEISPYVVVTIGLQPNIGAGCIVRSTNKQFDFSLGKTLAQKRELLGKRLIVS